MASSRASPSVRAFMCRATSASGTSKVACSTSVVNAARQSFRSPSESLARLFERYSATDLGVIADFLARNAARLRAETLKLRSPQPRRRAPKKQDALRSAAD